MGLCKWCYVIVKLCCYSGLFCCRISVKCLCVLCPPIRMIADCLQSTEWNRYLGFIGGFTLGIIYYNYLLKKIPFPGYVGVGLALGISLLLGVGNASCMQMRCISLLTVPMYCGKPGRGVLKAIALTYVVAGPITNMSLNAKEVVRVFACSNQLSYNLSKAKYALMVAPFQKAIFGSKKEIGEVKDTLRSIREVVAPIENEVEDMAELEKIRKANDYVDDLLKNMHRSLETERKYKLKLEEELKDNYQHFYLKKLEYRCQDLLSRAAKLCIEAFRDAYDQCHSLLPEYPAWMLCWPMKISYICNIMLVAGEPGVCDSRRQIDPGLEEGYSHMKTAKDALAKNFNDVKMQYLISNEELADIQDAKETGERVLHAFDEKLMVIKVMITVVNASAALLFLRIIVAAGTYHDRYLTGIEYDNIYVTGYFKRIDKSRREREKYTLLPLKKMERIKYIDIHSCVCLTTEHNKLFTQVLKVMLEMITATTFVMLDRLFYEALDVVRQHAEMDTTQQELRDLKIEVEGTGMLASIVRKILNSVGTESRLRSPFTTAPCLPRPRLMPPSYFVRIYGSYLWILLLLYLNPYTMRLRRLICSYFYPRREKQRILHLYNDILKKRMKMQKTLRRKAVQAVRAHYLSGENLLSLRMKFPQLLGWLRMFPAARMKCLICGETEPRDDNQSLPECVWHSCLSTKCPFVYCQECWLEVGEGCLACDPSLAELSDVDSLSEVEQAKY